MSSTNNEIKNLDQRDIDRLIKEIRSNTLRKEFVKKIFEAIKGEK
jgi:hypothetical protein